MQNLQNILKSPQFAQGVAFVSAGIFGYKYKEYRVSYDVKQAEETMYRNNHNQNTRYPILCIYRNALGVPIDTTD